jgi:hypothetical protein
MHAQKSSGRPKLMRNGHISLHDDRIEVPEAHRLILWVRLKDNGIAVEVFRAKEPESISRHFWQLDLQSPTCKQLVCGINVGAANIKADIPVCRGMSGVWFRRSLTRIVLSVQHPEQYSPLGRLDLW